MKLQDHPVLPSTTQYYPDSSIGSLCTKIPLPENSIHTKCHQDMILEKSQEGTAQSSKVHCAQGVQFPDTFHQWHLNQSRWLSHFFLEHVWGSKSLLHHVDKESFLRVRHQLPQFPNALSLFQSVFAVCVSPLMVFL